MLHHTCTRAFSGVLEERNPAFLFLEVSERAQSLGKVCSLTRSLRHCPASTGPGEQAVWTGGSRLPGCLGPWLTMKSTGHCGCWACVGRSCSFAVKTRAGPPPLCRGQSCLLEAVSGLPWCRPGAAVCPDPAAPGGMQAACPGQAWHLPRPAFALWGGNRAAVRQDTPRWRSVCGEAVSRCMGV